MSRVNAARTIAAVAILGAGGGRGSVIGVGGYLRKVVNTDVPRPARIGVIDVPSRVLTLGRSVELAGAQA